MKKILFFVVFVLFCLFGFSQNDDEKETFAFTITDYIQNPNDSISIVQIQMPKGFELAEKQIGILMRNYSNNKLDTLSIGYGRCQLIKGEYGYFGIKLRNKNAKPIAKDLLYISINYGADRKGLIYELTKQSIYFSSIHDSAFYNFTTAYWIDKKDEEQLIENLVIDIQFTGKAMLQQSPEQNQLIKGGIFNGKKLFDAMQICTDKDVIKFLKYVIARPKKYAGNTWKISETFATWMVGETPTVIE